MKIDVKTIIFYVGVPILAVVLGWWLSVGYDRYYQPTIEYESSLRYFKVGDISVGNISLYNTGRKPDTDITIVIKEVIKPEDFTVHNFIGDYKIKSSNGNTVITIDKFKPTEGADITFKVKTDVDYFEITNVMSDSGRIYEIRDVEEKSILLEEFIIILITTLVLVTILSLLRQKRMEKEFERIQKGSIERMKKLLRETKEEL